MAQFFLHEFSKPIRPKYGIEEVFIEIWHFNGIKSFFRSSLELKKKKFQWLDQLIGLVGLIKNLIFI